ARVDAGRVLLKPQQPGRPRYLSRPRDGPIRANGPVLEDPRLRNVVGGRHDRRPARRADRRAARCRLDPRSLAERNARAQKLTRVSLLRRSSRDSRCAGFGLATCCRSGRRRTEPPPAPPPQAPARRSTWRSKGRRADVRSLRSARESPFPLRETRRSRRWTNPRPIDAAVRSCPRPGACSEIPPRLAPPRTITLSRGQVYADSISRPA